MRGARLIAAATLFVLALDGSAAAIAFTNAAGRPGVGGAVASPGGGGGLAQVFGPSFSEDAGRLDRVLGSDDSGWRERRRAAVRLWAARQAGDRAADALRGGRA
jgi:hypothetical protein